MDNTDKIKKFVSVTLKCVVFVFCLFLIIGAHKTQSIYGLIVQLLGLAGLVGLLAVYNHPYSK